MLDLIRTQLQLSLDTLTKVLHDDSVHQSLFSAAAATAEAMKNGHKLLVCGNGGSAADTQHVVAELVVRLKSDRPDLRAIALTTDRSIFTAIGNDYGFDHIFSPPRKVEALGQPRRRPARHLHLRQLPQLPPRPRARPRPLAHHHRLHRQRRRQGRPPRRHQRHSPRNRHHEHPGVATRSRAHLLHAGRALLLRPGLRQRRPVILNLRVVLKSGRPRMLLDHRLSRIVIQSHLFIDRPHDLSHVRQL